MSRQENEGRTLSRRSLLKAMGLAPLLLRSAPLHGAFQLGLFDSGFLLSDARLTPRYPAQSPLEGVLRLVRPGSDEFVTEKYAFEIEAQLREWGEALKGHAPDSLLAVMAKSLDPSIASFSMVPSSERVLRTGNGIDCRKREFRGKPIVGRERFLEEFQVWLGHKSQVETAEFQITSIQETGPLAVGLEIRYDLVTQRNDDAREERVGTWRTEWTQSASGMWTARKWEAGGETLAVVRGRVFVDVSSQMLGRVESYNTQMLRGTDYWRTILDGACGIDVYGNSGVAAGDFDNDGFDDLYVCQPAGLPNRLYRNRGDGTMEDVTEKAGVGVLDSTACALFADFSNRGQQDLLVVCGSGPLLFVNQGDGSFALRREAFKFERPAEGSFTHAALADYDGDGRLDVYFCTYSYYLGLDQYHYPVPYFDARNGPANFLFHNEGDGTFVERTKAAGLDADNNRYSFACAWGHAVESRLPDLYVANDFGRANLYRNNGDGTFVVASKDASVEDPGAGMSACWADFNNDGSQDIYAANMWSAAGQRVSGLAQFHEKAPEAIRALYRRHARGNSLYRNQGKGIFQNVSREAGAEMGRWSWCSDFWDFDHDGYPDLYVANGYISAPNTDDLGSFFWRQVVGKSPEDASPSSAYEHGWNALNELIRSDGSWSGYERNVMFANNRDGTFSEVSGAVGLDFPEDGRSFALADFDHDGRLEVVVKNRNAPQLRISHNVLKDAGASIAFRLRGTRSNRDGIGAAISVKAGDLLQTKYLQAGSGFLAQHTKEVFFGLGKPEAPVQMTVKATVRWPSGLTQNFEQIPMNHRIEIEEGSATFAAKPFAAANEAWAHAGPSPRIEPLPAQAGTWLIEPLKAPEFSLPDLAGNTRTLRSLLGKNTLLIFWATTAPSSTEQLQILQRRRAALIAGELQVVAVNVDEAANNARARAFAMQGGFSFPVLLATEDLAGVYNIIYRYLFDRRRDLALPSSFLLDHDGMIVKMYQGTAEPQALMADVKSMPTTASGRLQRALPWPGERFQLYRGSFQRNDFTYGVALFQHGYLDAAAASFEQVIAQKPDNAEAHYNLGTLHLRRNDLEQARQYMEQTVKLRSNYPEAWNNLGMIAAQQGQPEEAVRDFQESLNQRPNYGIALLNLGNLYRRQGAFDQALTFLHRALEVEPDDPEISYSLGMFYAQQGQTQSAADFLRKAVVLRPDYPEALNNLGVLFVRDGKLAEAKIQFERCIRVAPNFDQSYINLARLYVMQKDKQKAIEALQELLRVQPQHEGAQQALEMLRSQP